MRFIVITAAFAIACSDASQEPSKDAATEDVANATDAADATETTVATDAAPSQGACAACTANDCLAELEACGGSQACTNDLVAFNNCLSAHDSNCGTTFAAGGADEASLWSCLESKCASVCGTN